MRRFKIRRSASYRGFESHPLRQCATSSVLFDADPDTQGLTVPAPTLLAPASSQPTAGSLPADSHERADWVDMWLVKSFMQDTVRSLLASTIVIWVIAAMLYKSASTPWLLVWLLVCQIVIACRYLVVKQYQQTMGGVDGRALRIFLRRYDFLWPAGGFLWGISSLLFLGKSTGFEQFIFGLILIGVSCFAVYSYAARLQCYFSFANAVTGTTVGVFIYGIAVGKSLSLGTDSISLIFLAVVFHLMLRYFAIRFHVLQRKSLQLQFDNDVLVKSLTARNIAALDAVENKNRFIASAAHDLRQPVHALNLYASWLVDEPELGPQVAPQIVRCTNAVNDLFNSLFDFSGLHADAPPIDKLTLSLAEVLGDLRLQYAPLARSNGIQLRLHKCKANADTLIVSDPVLLKRLLGNLISNAIKNTLHGGVLLAQRQHAGRWRIEVWDTGVGIDAAHQEAIFKEFYRVPRQGTEEGFGLGLAIASRLSQVLGLAVKMRSIPGRGSVFWIEGHGDMSDNVANGWLTKDPAFLPSGRPVNGFSHSVFGTSATSEP